MDEKSIGGCGQILCDLGAESAAATERQHSEACLPESAEQILAGRIKWRARCKERLAGSPVHRLLGY